VVLQNHWRVLSGWESMKEEVRSLYISYTNLRDITLKNVEERGGKGTGERR
jgi:hypothetical protein